MRDDQLLQDLEKAVHFPNEKNDWLREYNITSYSQLFAFIEDESNNAKRRWDACYIVHRLWKTVDKRRAVPPLLAALNASDEQVRWAAANALGMLKSQRAVVPLLRILGDRTDSVTVRHWVIDALNMIGDERALPLFWQIINDPTEHVELRSRAIEEMFERPEPIQRFVTLFVDPVPDIRFWAAYALGHASSPEALSELDRIVAHDHILPICWGWHVDREAMLPLETIYYRKTLGFYENNSEGEYPWYGMGNVYLISPAPEYDTLMHDFREWHDDYYYTTKPLLEITFRLDADWLAEKLRAQWPEIRLNVREPRPESYILDWHLQIEDQNLLGGLHRDRYGVVLTSPDDALVYAFAAWYRSLFSAEQPLYFYEWADYGIPLTSGISAEELGKIIDERDTKRRTGFWKPPSDDAQPELV